MASDNSEMRALELALANAAAMAEIRADLIVRKAALDMSLLARKKVPVDTGYLRASIGVTLDDLRAEIGPTAHYGANVEYGTARQRAQPYMMPAADEIEPIFRKAMGQLGEEITKWKA